MKDHAYDCAVEILKVKKKLKKCNDEKLKLSNLTRKFYLRFNNDKLLLFFDELVSNKIQKIYTMKKVYSEKLLLLLIKYNVMIQSSGNYPENLTGMELFLRTLKEVLDINNDLCALEYVSDEIFSNFMQIVPKDEKNSKIIEEIVIKRNGIANNEKNRKRRKK